MAARMTTALIACFFLLLSSQSAFAQSSDKSKKDESSSSQQTDQEDTEEKKDDEKKADKEADKKKTILHRIGSVNSDDAGSLADTLSEGADNGGMDHAFKNASRAEASDGEAGDASASKPGVLPGRPLVTGSLDKDEIRKVIKSHREPVTACYEQRLKEKPALAGRIKVKFTIADSGKVIAAMVKSSEVGDRELEACLTEEIRSWTFPKPKGGGIVVVNYPFNFSTSDK